MRTLQISKAYASLLTVILAGAPLLPASQAQDPENAAIVNVPFAFANGSQHFTAGLYTISTDDQHIVSIRGESSSGFAMAWFNEDSQPSKTTKVVFSKCGDQYFLHEIWVAGETSHTYLPPSKAEKLETSANRAAPTSVVVAALEPSHQ
jgi:hypothetical protein